MSTLNWNRIFSALVCLTLILTLPNGNVSASPTLQGEADFAAIDAYVTEQMNRLGIPGMALGIVQNGRIAHVQGFGIADSSGRAVTPQTPFYIGSVTKSFTALAVMQLVEAGKIDSGRARQNIPAVIRTGGQRCFRQAHSAQSAEPELGYLDQIWEPFFVQRRSILR